MVQWSAVRTRRLPNLEWAFDSSARSLAPHPSARFALTPSSANRWRWRNGYDSIPTHTYINSRLFPMGVGRNYLQNATAYDPEAVTYDKHVLFEVEPRMRDQSFLIRLIAYQPAELSLCLGKHIKPGGGPSWNPKVWPLLLSRGIVLSIHWVVKVW